MKRIASSSNAIDYREEPSFPVAMLAAGLAGTAFVLAALGGSSLAAVALAVVGAMVFQLRDRVRLDVTGRRVSWGWGLPGLPLARSVEATELDVVRITKPKGPRIRGYIIHVVTRDGTEILLADRAVGHEAHRLSAEAAEALGIGRVDARVQPPEHSSAAVVNETVRQRVARTGSRPVEHPAPPDTACAVDRTRTDVQISIPAPQAFNVIAGVSLPTVFVFMPALWWVNAKEMNRTLTGPALHHSMLLSGLGIIGVPLLMLILYVAGRAVRTTLVTAGRDGLRVRIRGLLWSSELFIPGDDLRPLLVDGPSDYQELVAYSNGQLVQFGEGRSDAEIQWILSVIETAVAGSC